MITKLFQLIEDAPVAKGIGVTTWLLWFLTGIVTLTSGEIPGGWSWVMAMGGMSGIGSMQGYFTKRREKRDQGRGKTLSQV